MNREVIIIGSGPAALTAAIYLGRAGRKPLIINGYQIGGQLTTTTEVENFPGFSEGIQGPDLIENMTKQAEKFGAEFAYGEVVKIEKDMEDFVLTTGFDEKFKSKTVIVSTGSSAKYLNILGEKELLGNGVSACATCDGFFFKDKKVVVVGGGDTAFEEAIFLSKLAKEVTLINRSEIFKASKIMYDRAVDLGVKILPNLVPVSINGETNVQSITVMEKDNKERFDIETDAVFVAIGHKPNTDFLKGFVDLDNLGYIITKSKSTETNIDGLFACGDVQDPVYRQAITAAGTGCMAAIDVQKYLNKN